MVKEKTYAHAREPRCPLFSMGRTMIGPIEVDEFCPSGFFLANGRGCR
jgi:hypothetical protein